MFARSEKFSSNIEVLSQMVETPVPERGSARPGPRANTTDEQRVRDLSRARVACVRFPFVLLKSTAASAGQCGRLLEDSFEVARMEGSAPLG